MRLYEITRISSYYVTKRPQHPLLRLALIKDVQIDDSLLYTCRSRRLRVFSCLALDLQNSIVNTVVALGDRLFLREI